MSIAVCGIGIVSAIGIGAGETLGNLRTGRSGIGKPTLLGSAVDVPVGEEFIAGIQQYEREVTSKR